MILCCVFCSTFEVVGGVCSVQDYLVYMHHMERPVLGKRNKNRLMKSLNVDGVLKFDCGGLFFVFSLVAVVCKYIWIYTVLLNHASCLICHLENSPVSLWRQLRTCCTIVETAYLQKQMHGLWPLWPFHFQWQMWESLKIMSQMVTIIRSIHLGVTQQLKVPMATTPTVIHLRIITLQVVRWSTRNRCEQHSFTTMPSTAPCCFTTALKTHRSERARPSDESASKPEQGSSALNPGGSS